MCHWRLSLTAGPSSQSAATSSSSWFLYGQSKGLTEEALAALDYSQTTILRPAALIKPGPKSGWWESAFGSVARPCRAVRDS